jgi:hypothetical protein
MSVELEKLYRYKHKERNPFKCYFCGKFFSYKESYYSWTPYGGYEDIEPPDEEFSHKKCYENYDGKELIHSTSWLKPTLTEIKL